MIPVTDDWAWYIHTCAVYAALVRDRHHFAEASYGDGEWMCILGYEGQTSNGQVYEPWLGDQLRETLLHPVGQWFSYWGTPDKPFRLECDQWLREHDLDLVWFARRPLPAANCNGKLGPVFRAMQRRRCVCVGPAHFKRMNPEVLGDFIHVEVTDNRAYEQVDEVCRELLGMVKRDDLVMFSAGLASAVMVHQLWPAFRGVATLWDVGAVFDPYCGVYSRKTYKSEDWQRDVMPLNLE